jgi:RHS repeat-associated protein
VTLAGCRLVCGFRHRINDVAAKSLENPLKIISLRQRDADMCLGSSETLEPAGYTYDALNRLTNAASKAAAAGDNLYNEALTYDDLGNILTLTRNKGAGTALNKMYYSYMWTGVRSNQLHTIADNGTVAESQATTYAYNTNGSLTNDTKKTAGIAYNELNLPKLATITGPPGKTITYVYDAAGTKLERLITASDTVKEDRFYVAGIEYVGSTTDFIHTPEGRAIPPTGAGDVAYEYNATDHLGNIRVVFGDVDRDGILEAGEIKQTNDYYAFGREIAYTGATTPTPDNQYKYNGKEYQFDLAEYDYGARFYDAIIGRWDVVDPMAEKGRRWSPYNYVMNNPIRNIDPDGMWTAILGGYTTSDPREIAAFINDSKDVVFVTINVYNRVQGKAADSDAKADSKPKEGDRNKKGEIYSEDFNSWLPAAAYRDWQIAKRAQHDTEERLKKPDGFQQGIALVYGLGKESLKAAAIYAATEGAGALIAWLRVAGVAEEVVVLGRVGEYEVQAEKIGATYFKTNNWSWAENQAFLDEVAKSGAKIICSSNANFAAPGSIFYKEVMYLVKKYGYKISEDGLSLIDK